MLSHAERRQFQAIAHVLAADPLLASASRAADRRLRRRRVWLWLAPLLVTRRQARRTQRLLRPGF